MDDEKKKFIPQLAIDTEYFQRAVVIFLKTSAPLSLMTTYRMSLISAGSISLDSTFNTKFA
jgi:hypothetical protein